MTMTPETQRVVERLADRIPRAEAQIETARQLIEIAQEAGENVEPQRALLEETIAKVAQWQATLQAHGMAAGS